MIYQCLGFLAHMREQMTRLADDGADLDEITSRLDLSRYRDWRNAGNKQWMDGNIARLYQEISGQNQQQTSSPRTTPGASSLIANRTAIGPWEESGLIQH